MTTDPPQAENLAYWLRRFEALRRQARLAEAQSQRITQLEGDMARLEVGILARIEERLFPLLLESTTLFMRGRLAEQYPAHKELEVTVSGRCLGELCSVATDEGEVLASPPHYHVTMIAETPDKEEAEHGRGDGDIL